jgi:hypothetical protein
MLSFSKFLKESTYKTPGEIFNAKQMKAIANHPDYKTYVHHYDHKIYARPHKRDNPESGVRNIVMANAAQKHTMTVAITKHGKILNHEIHQKAGDNEWRLIKQPS